MGRRFPRINPNVLTAFLVVSAPVLIGGMAGAVIAGAGDGANKVEQSAMLLQTVGQIQCAVRCRTDMSGLSAVGAGT